MEINRKIGNDIAISQLGFGAWAIGGGSYGNVGLDDAMDALDCYFENGGNFIDTAQGYANSEEIIGNYLESRNLKNKAVIATKTPLGETLESIGQIEASLDVSLKKLKRDYVDVFYFHSPSEDEELIAKGIEVMEELKQKGKIRKIAASIKGVNVTSDTVDLCNKYINTEKIDVIQLVYSILRQQTKECFANAQEKGVALVGRTSLESGLLTGKYQKGHVFPEGDHRNRWGENIDVIIQSTLDIKEKYISKDKSVDDSMIGLAIRFAMYPEEITNTIIGAKNKQQMEDIIKIYQKEKLSSEIYHELEVMFKGKTSLYNTI